MSATQTAVDRVRATAAAAKKAGVRTPQLDVGDYVRQGDLYVYRIAGVPKGARPIAARAQLAPGETQGSRHVLDSLDGVTMHALADPNALQGPILTLTEARTLTHPEHAHIVFEPSCCYFVTYQRLRADELLAVRD